MRVTIGMYHRGTAHKIAEETFEAERYQDVISQDEPLGILNWIKFEIAPYWPRSEIYLDWYTDEPQFDAAIYGVVASWGYLN